ncbi:MAG: hypothetical protein ABJB98_06055 [Actinomycetota bacterium]
MNVKIKAIIGLTAAAGIVSLSACSSGSSNSDAKSGSAGAQVTPVAKIDDLSKGKTTAVALDAGFVKALESLKLTPGVVGTAKLEGGSVSFPITGGNVTYYTPGTKSPFVQGDIKHEGSGLSLTAGATKVELTNFEIDPGTSHLFGDVSVNGQSAAKHAYLFYLNGTTLKPLQAGPDNTAILQGTTVTVSGDAAGVLNKVFKTDAVKAGLTVGIATITVQTK